jgi:hypothetical protein
MYVCVTLFFSVGLPCCNAIWCSPGHTLFFSFNMMSFFMLHLSRFLILNLPNNIWYTFCPIVMLLHTKCMSHWLFASYICMCYVSNFKSIFSSLSYPVFMPKSSTHRMHDPWSIVSHIRPKVFTDNQMSRIEYNYYINNISKDYDDSQRNGTTKDSITPQERQPEQHVA